MKNYPKISLVTCCYNSDKTIEETILSVLKQDYQNYEHVIMDGASTDNTLNIIKKYEEKYEGKLILVSEKDKGIYDAFNKGVKKASGDVIGIVSSDDILANEFVFSKIANTFQENECEGTYSDLLMLDNDTMTKIVRKWKTNKGNFRFGWFPPHPTVFLKRDIYDKFGYFDSSLKIAADYDFIIRILKNKVKLSYIPEVLVKMRIGGASTGGLGNYILSFKESYTSLKKNNIRFALVANICRTGRVFLQLINKHQ